MAFTEEDILRKVRALMERANHASTPDEEKDTARKMADELMLKYAIEQAVLDESRPAESRAKPELVYFDICEAGNPLWRQLTDIAGLLASHCRCRDVYRGLQADGRYGVQIGLIGYSADLRYFEMLFTSLILQLGANLEPKPNPSKTLAENVYLMHEAGVKWRRIAVLLNRTHDEMETVADVNGACARWRKEVRPSKDQPQLLIPWPDGHRLINLYRKHCKEIGEEPRAITSPVAYQRNFAESFFFGISDRLWEMNQRNQSVGTALALRTEAVNEMYAEQFSDVKSLKKKRKGLRYEGAARKAGRKAAEEADLGLRRSDSPSRRGQLT